MKMDARIMLVGGMWGRGLTLDVVTMLRAWERESKVLEAQGYSAMQRWPITLSLGSVLCLAKS